MQKRLTYFLFLFTLYSPPETFAQQDSLDVLTYYLSDHLPDELNRNTLEYVNNVSRYYESEFGKDNNLPNDFVYEYSFFLDQINKSGFVLYDNDISAYLNELKNDILTKNNITHPIKVYLIDYPQLNAFTNDFGSIYVSVGAVARLESDKELILLLAHEISHVLLRHSYNAEIYEKQLKDEQWSNNGNTSFNRHAFSRKQELEADSMAVTLVGKFLTSDDVSGLMGKLKLASNPIYSGAIDFGLISYQQEEIESQLENDWNQLKNDTINTVIDNSNRESTHPDIDLRLEKMLSLGGLFFEKNTSYKFHGNFDRLKKVAQKLIYKTYLHNENYIEALDLVLKLRTISPNNLQLKNNQLHIQTLIAQEKYMSSPHSILNVYGESCQDQDFLRFKQFISELNPVDLNIINEMTSREFKASKSIRDNNFRMMYRYNADIFVSDSSNSFEFVTWDSTLSIRKDFVKYKAIDSTIIDSLSKLGYINSYVSPSAYLLQNFLLEELDRYQSNLIKLEVDRKKRFDGNISWDEFDLAELNPIKTANKYKRKNEFLKSDNYDYTTGVAKVIDQSFFVKSKTHRYYGEKYTSFFFKFKETLSLRDGFKNSIMDYPAELDITNNSEKNVSVSNNYLHRLALAWINDLSNEQLIYSKINEEMKEHFLDKGLGYISIVLCITTRRGAERNPFTIYYELYFDIENQGIAYISKIGSKQKLNEFQMKQFRYLSNYHKTVNP